MQRAHYVSTVHYVSTISHGTSSPLCIPSSRDQDVKAREHDGLACRTYDQPNYFYRVDPSMPLLVNQSVVENHYTEGTCLIRSEEEHLLKEQVVSPVRNAGSNLTLNVPQE